MSDHYILSLDPGKSSGISLGVIPKGGPYHLVDAWQFGGGAMAVKNWLKKRYVPAHQVETWELDWVDVPGRFYFPGVYWRSDYSVISERFQPINHSNYALTTDSVEPLRCEGVLLGLGVMPDVPDERWRAPAQQYVVGGASLAEKKKRSRKFLKDTGNYRMPKQLGTPDSDDAMSATLHGISYAMKSLRSAETFTMVREWTEQNG